MLSALAALLFALLLTPAACLAQNTADSPPRPTTPPEEEAEEEEVEAASEEVDAAAAEAEEQTEEEAAAGNQAEAPAGASPPPSGGDPPEGPVIAEQPAAPNAAEQPVDAPAEGEVNEAEAPAVEGRGDEQMFPRLDGEGGMMSQLQNLTNAAEGRSSGAGAGNLAEGESSGPAEPPGAPFDLGTPDELAGSVEDYVPPTIDLVLPSLEPPPPPPSSDAFFQPERSYLEDRPLPGLDVTETDEERNARNIEDSLRLINLAMENRPAEGMQIPLPSGIVTFKASDAFEFDRRNNILRFTGNAELIFSDIAIWGDMVEINDSAATAYARGYVAVQQKDEILFADEAYLNYDAMTLELYNVEGNTGGSRMQDGVLYFRAQRVRGTFDHMIMDKVETTTCDPFCGEVEEYHLSAKKVVYKKDKSIVMYNVHPYIRSHKIGYIPIIAIPLLKESRPFEQEESDIQQNYGFNRSEGFFAKFAYTYSVKWHDKVQDPLKGVVKLDVTQRQGPGLGVRQDFYINGLGVTTIRAFYQQDWPEEIATGFFGRKRANGDANFDFTLDQELNLSRSTTGNLAIERTNRVVPSLSDNIDDRRTNTWNNRFNLNYKKGDTTAGLTASQNIRIDGGFTNTNGTQEPKRETNTSQVGFDLTQQINDETRFTFRDNYRYNKGGNRVGIAADQEGDLQMQLDWQGRKDSDLDGYKVNVSYRESGIDYDQDRNTTDRNVTINKELPSIKIDLPADLINDGAYFNRFQVSFDNLVTGRRTNPESSFRTKMSIGGRDTYEFSRSSRLDTSVNFDQFWYDDGNAQYQIAPQLRYSYDNFDWFRFNLGYQLNFRQGVRVPPVQSDRTSYRQNLTYDFSFSNRRSWRWDIRGGYRFDDYLWNPVVSTFNWDPNRTFGLTQSVTYDIERARFNPSTLTASIRSPYVAPDGTYNWLLRFTMDHDIESKFSLTRFDVRYFRRYDRGWSGEITGSFRDGRDVSPEFSRRFFGDFIRKVVVRKVNCCTTLEAGWRSGIHEFYLNVYLNALPQYPGTFDRYQTDTSGNIDYETQFLFPSDALRNDILQDLFGINQRFGF